MDKETKDKLFEAWAYCDWQDKSTPYMFAFMESVANISHDQVLDFIVNESDNRSEWYKNNPNWTEKYKPF